MWKDWLTGRKKTVVLPGLMLTHIVVFVVGTMVGDLKLPTPSPAVVLSLPAEVQGEVADIIEIAAQARSPIAWDVPIELKAREQGNSLWVVAKRDGVYTIRAIVSVSGKPPLSAWCKVNVGKVEPGPGPNPPVPPVVGAKLFLTVVWDVDKMTPAVAGLVESESLRRKLTEAGHQFRVYDVKSPVIAEKKLTKWVQEGGGPPVLIAQSLDGQVRWSGKLPVDEAGVLEAIKKAGGK